MTLKYKFTPKKYQFKVLALTLDNLLCMTSVGLLQKLMRQTAVYGLSSIVARLLNYLLVPLYTRLLSPDEYGIVTEMYSYVAFLIVLYTYGMETAFFNTLRSEEENKYTIYSTSFWSLLLSTVVFSTILCVLSQPIAELLHYPQQAHFVRYIALILALDTLATLPFAWLRYEEKALRFAIIRLITIGANIGLNIFFLVLCPKYADSVAWIKAIYLPQMGVGYIFLSNLISSALCLLLLLPELLAVRWEWNKALWRTMVWYGLPLVVVGLAGSINEVLDRLLLKHLLPYDTARNLAELGIYGACYKLSILMTLFTQAYRFAVEPLFFKEAGQKDSPNFYANTTRYYIAVTWFIFLGVLLFLPILQHFIGRDFRSGLSVVPILLAANLFLGLYYNLSIWYKLSNKTHLGAIISLIGSLLTIVLNVWWIPIWGYLGSAYATLICYSSMCIISYFWGQKHYPIPYPIPLLLLYTLTALVLWQIDSRLFIASAVGQYGFKIFLLSAYIGIIVYLEKRQAFSKQ